MQKRLLRAKVEFQTAHTYDYFVVNDTVENAVRELDAIITAEHCKPRERMSIHGGMTAGDFPDFHKIKAAQRQIGSRFL